MIGINKFNGKSISGVEYLQQRLDTLLTTPRMTRVMRRQYAGIFHLVDKPVNKAFLVDLYAATAVSIKRWEPELKIRQITLESVSQGKVNLRLDGQFVELGQDGKSKKPQRITLNQTLSKVSA
jgi:phage baseplate assembly protein W